MSVEKLTNEEVIGAIECITDALQGKGISRAAGYAAMMLLIEHGREQGLLPVMAVKGNAKEEVDDA